MGNISRKTIGVIIALFCIAGIAYAGIFILAQQNPSVTQKDQTLRIAGTKQADSINWVPYEKGMELLKDGNKKGFIHFYTDWCIYCKMMAKSTFKDRKVINYANRRFIAIRVNADQQKEVAKRYNVVSFPRTYFIDEDQKILGMVPGLIQPDYFLAYLKYVDSESYKKMPFQDYIENR